MRKSEIAKKLAKFYLRYGRGSSLVNFLWETGRNFVYLGLALDLAYRYLHITLPIWMVAPIPIVVIIIYYTLGRLDEKVGFWKIQNDYQSEELTPFFKRLDEKINKIINEKEKEEKTI